MIMHNVFPASLTFSRPNGHPVEIQVRDKLSGTSFSIHISRLDLMDALLGLGDVPCSLEMYNRNTIGWKREIKDVSIDMTGVHYDKVVWQAAAMDRLVEGGHLGGDFPWVPQTLEHNQHKIHKNMFSVTLIRYVPATDEDFDQKYHEMGDHRLEDKPPIPRPKQR